ncbi:MAG: hypothetical protein AB7I04_05260 [Pseudomonadales bacterium]
MQRTMQQTQQQTLQQTLLAALTIGPVVFGLTACGSSIEGVYTGEETFLDQIEIRDDERVELMFMGAIREGIYNVEGDRLRITAGGETNVFRINDSGCLEGGALLGTYCRSGSSSGSSTSSTASRSEPAAGYVGQTFAAGPIGDQMVIEFVSGDRVRFEVDGESEELRYGSDGGDIVIYGMAGDNMILTPRGRDLEGGPGGMTIVFHRM